nr:trichodiene synthase [Trichoderma crystalligenum]
MPELNDVPGEEEFPRATYLETMVRLLDTVSYNDENFTDEERTECLKYAYGKAAEHFAQPHVQETLKVPPKRMAAALKTIVGMCVYSWCRVSKEVMADLSIHYTYTLLLDDSREEPAGTMATWYEDLLNARPQSHGWWRLVNDFIPNVLRHYGGYCQMNMVRSTIDFFQGCWIEQHNFKGYLGASDYPGFLRRINGLGHCVGSSIWPIELVDEEKHFLEITTAIAQMENWMVWTNDLFSFYKEYFAERDQTSLVNNYVECEGITLDQALDKLCKDTIRSSEEIIQVWQDKDPKMYEILTRFLQGYITWHLCDDRYRLVEVYQAAGDDETAQKFKKYVESARRVGAIDPARYAVPSVTELSERAMAQQSARRSWGFGIGALASKISSVAQY